MNSIIELIKQRKQLFHLRLNTSRSRNQHGRCTLCGREQKCENWCYGPEAKHFIKLAFQNWDQRQWIWNMYKENLKWAGMEPWHRYE